MLGGHEEIARLGWVVGSLFGNVVSARAIGVVPVAGERLSKDRVQWLFHTSAVENHVKTGPPCFIRMKYVAGKRTEV